MKALAGIFILFYSFSLHGQINAYAQVTSISSTTLTIGTSNETYGTFITGLPVIIMQMQDNTIGSNTTNASSFGTLSSIQSVGQYEIAHITSVSRTPGLTQVTISSPLANTYNINSNGSVQLISYPLLNAGNYTTVSDISAVAWNGSVGGVVSFRVGGTLTLNHNITADNAGFRGGAVNSGNAGSCDNSTYIAATSENFGNKGESIYKATNTSFAGGRGRILNGGGGGNSHNGGGGGGSNASAGGEGGRGYGCTLNAGGLGGATLYSFVSSSRAFMGGGGGSGEANNNYNTAGGNGGGIVIITANQIRTSGSGSSLRISANGQTAADVGNDGAGGGGAGGSVMLQVNSWNIAAGKTLTISSNGGSGGNVTDATAHGGGGGGGQGAVIFSTATPSTNITTRTLNGTGGRNYAGGTFADNGAGSDNVGIFNSSFALLPAKLISFTVRKMLHENVLDWQMVNDENIAYYDIQRSYDGYNFETIGKVQNKSQAYSFSDVGAEDKNVYYRILLRANSGALEYTSIVMIRSKNRAPLYVALAPNPVRSHTLLKVESGHAATGVVRIVNSMGMLLRSQNINLAKGENNIQLSDLASLATGTYKVVVNAGNNTCTLKMLVIR